MKNINTSDKQDLKSRYNLACGSVPLLQIVSVALALTISPLLLAQPSEAPSPFSKSEFSMRSLEQWTALDQNSMSPEHQEAKAECRQKYPNNQMRMNDPNCRFEMSVKTRWSSELDFQMILKLKNKQHSLSSYDRSENFFSLLKSFYLDQDFSCKDQVSWFYFNSLLGHSASATTSSCARFMQINLTNDYSWLERQSVGEPNTPADSEKTLATATTATKVAIQLPVENLESVDVILVSPGDNLRSRWGHVMFRLGFSQPITKYDEAKNLYFSIYEDPSLKSGFFNFLPGLLAQSQLRAEFWSEDALTLGYSLQNRNLEFYRLNFSPRERRKFFAFATAMHQGGYGNWQHVSQNCTSSAIDLLHASSTKFQKHFLMELTPQQLVESLRAIPGLITKQGPVDLSGDSFGDATETQGHREQARK